MKKNTFRETIKALKNRKMLFLLLLGMSSGLPFALTLGTLQAWMTELDISLKTIGLFAFLRLPFSLKFLWSPLMDRYAPPFLDRRRGWAVITQILVGAALVGMAVTDPVTQIQQLVILTLLVNFFAASQDVVLDAYRREVLDEQELGLGVGVFVNGYILSFRYISGAMALLLPAFVGGWSGVYLLMALLMGVFVIITFLAPSVVHQATPPTSIREAFVGPLKEYFSRPEALVVLAFVILYKVGDGMAGTMTLPFILQTGFSKEEYVAIVKLWGPLATLIGALIGGHYVLKLGIVRSLWVMGFLQAFSTAGFALLSLTGKNNWALSGIVGFENLTAQMGTAAYAAYMASVTNIKFTATQYALLSSLMAIPGVIFASRTGDLAQTWGWNGFFIFCAVAAIPAMILIPNLKDDKKASKRVKVIVFVTIVAGIYAVSTSAWDLFQMFLPKVVNE